jgi:hypothetical protein
MFCVSKSQTADEKKAKSLNKKIEEGIDDAKRQRAYKILLLV